MSDPQMKFIVVGSILLFTVGYAWMQTAKNALDTNIGFVVMGMGLIGAVVTGCVLLHSLQLL
jgi:hypothetical protein